MGSLFTGPFALKPDLAALANVICSGTGCHEEVKSDDPNDMVVYCNECCEDGHKARIDKLKAMGLNPFCKPLSQPGWRDSGSECACGCTPIEDKR